MKENEIILVETTRKMYSRLNDFETKFILCFYWFKNKLNFLKKEFVKICQSFDLKNFFVDKNLFPHFLISKKLLNFCLITFH